MEEKSWLPKHKKKKKGKLWCALWMDRFEGGVIVGNSSSCERKKGKAKLGKTNNYFWDYKVFSKGYSLTYKNRKV